MGQITGVKLSLGPFPHVFVATLYSLLGLQWLCRFHFLVRRFNLDLTRFTCVWKVKESYATRCVLKSNFENCQEDENAPA